MQRPAQRRRRGPRRPRLPLLRAPWNGQDLHGADPRQGPQLREPGRRRARLRPAPRAWRSTPAPASTSTSSTPPRTTASRPSATSSPRRRSARPGAPRCTSSTRSTCSRTAASNALLKTLEEPPDHVVFVLATTDPQKVLPTIRSRTQHFEVHLLPASDLEGLVDFVVADAGLELSPEGRTYVLRTGGGSARDTLSALDRVVAAGGVPDSVDAVDELVEALCDHDTGRALVAVESAMSRGRNPRVLGESLIARLRDVFLASVNADLVPALGGRPGARRRPGPPPVGRRRHPGPRAARRGLRRHPGRARPPDPARGRAGPPHPARCRHLRRRPGRADRPARAGRPGRRRPEPASASRAAKAPERPPTPPAADPRPTAPAGRDRRRR